LTWYVGVLAVSLVDVILDICEKIAVHCYIYFPITTHDEQPQNKGWSMKRMRYGDHPREYLFHLCPIEAPNIKRDIVYIHGGGFVACNAGVLMPNLTAFCRMGFDVYVINYSHNPFPAGIISTLKALDFLRMKLGIIELGIFGDSAGGNLVLQSAACVTNPSLLAHILKIANLSNCWKFSFPEIKVCASICGLLDRTAVLEKRLKTIMYIENLFMILMVKFSVWMYESKISLENYGNWGVNIPVTELVNLPPTRIIAGTQDPLVWSSWKVFRILVDNGFPVEFWCYPGRHIFFGFPSWWLFGNWKVAAQPCLYDLAELFWTHLSPEISEI